MRARVLCAAVLILASVAARCSTDGAATRPNIVVILADDIGYSDLGVQGGTLAPTPHIDSIASGGVRFTDGYVPAPVCSPSRAGLVTSRYPQRFAYEWGPAHRRFGLPTSERTLVGPLREMGYATAIIGKWHLGTAPEFLPMRHAFDEFYGTLSNSAYFNPMLVDSRLGPGPRRIADHAFYTTEAYAERSVGFITSHADRPFFLYLAFNACHDPLKTPEKYTARLSRLTDLNQRLYAACLSALDDAVGRVLVALREKNLERSTLVFFLSDNGGPFGRRGSRNGPLSGHKGDTWEGGIRVPFFASWSGEIPAGVQYDEPVISLDVLATAFAAAGGKAQPEWQLDGVDLLPYLKGERDAPPHAALFWRYGPQWAVRKGNWKLVQGRDLATWQASPQLWAAAVEARPRLIDLASDIGEQRDLTPSHPEKAEELRRAWEAWNRELREPAWPPPSRRKGSDPNDDGE